MRFFFKRWLDFETKWGDEQSPVPQRRVATFRLTFLSDQLKAMALGCYEVGLALLLLRFAQDEHCETLIACLLREVSATGQRVLSDLFEKSKISEILISGFKSVDSPDALFDIFSGLESMICRDFVSTSLLHASGAFGQMARRIILSFKRASFEAIVKLYDDVEVMSLEAKVPQGKSHAMQRYAKAAEQKFLDSADTILRLGSMELPVQTAILSLANLNLEMGHVDDALQALEDSIRASQETSDQSSLCACLYLLSFILPSGSRMMQRCLERAEALNLPNLQCFCCLSLATGIATGQTESFPASQAGLLGLCGHENKALSLSSAQRALAHVTMASLLAESRPKVLQCNAAVAQVFGLKALSQASCKLLDFYQEEKEEITPKVDSKCDSDAWIQSAEALRARPEAVSRWRLAVNEQRLQQGQLLAAHLSLREVDEPLMSARIHVKAGNPVEAMASCMRCLSETSGLLDVKKEALLLMAQLKLEVHDVAAALHLAEEVPLLPPLCGDVLLLQAEALFELLATSPETRLLEAIVERLERAAKSFTQSARGRCHYLLARCFHELGNTAQRDFHAREFRLTRQPVRSSTRS